MQKLFIHIGLPKTATSSIQTFLYDNPEFLSLNNLRYVQSGLNKNLKCHHDLVWKLGLHKGPSYVTNNIHQEKQKIISSLHEENKKFHNKNLIISSELLTFLDDYSKLQDLLNIFKDRKIIFFVTLREQDRFLESLYQQVVKDGCEETFSEWFSHSKNIADYQALLVKLLKIANIEDVMINIFHKDKENINPIEDFLKLLGIQENIIRKKNIKNEVENESLSNDAIELIRISNKLKLDINYFLVDKLNKIQHSKAKYLNEKQRINIKEYFYASNIEFIKNVSGSDKLKKILLINEK